MLESRLKQMRICVLHTHYQQPGGEDHVFASEVALLQSRGHEVTTITFHNRELAAMSGWRQIRSTLWNHQVYRQVRTLLRTSRSDVLHIHNTFPLASPAVIRAASAEQVPIAMTLHNYRLLCPNALFFRDGRVCEDCLMKAVPWPGVLHGCWRGRAPSMVVTTMLTLHRLLETWKKVQRFIVLSEFARQKFIAGGLSPDKLVVKPNFVSPDPGLGAHDGNFALFVGRLSAEKGVDTLLKAWQQLGNKLSLKIVGDGPLAETVRIAAQQTSGVEWLGFKTRDEVQSLMSEATCLIFPSKCYENFPNVIAEALSHGLPVIASNLGSHGSLVSDGRVGLLFETDSSNDLVNKVSWLISHPEEFKRMQREARIRYETSYTAEQNYKSLLDIYHQAIDSFDTESVT